VYRERKWLDGVKEREREREREREGEGEREERVGMGVLAQSVHSLFSSLLQRTKKEAKGNTGCGSIDTASFRMES
jgi:hypothetical protein